MWFGYNVWTEFYQKKKTIFLLSLLLVFWVLFLVLFFDLKYIIVAETDRGEGIYLVIIFELLIFWSRINPGVE